jgi:hypothetical protein
MWQHPTEAQRKESTTSRRNGVDRPSENPGWRMSRLRVQRAPPEFQHSAPSAPSQAVPLLSSTEPIRWPTHRATLCRQTFACPPRSRRRAIALLISLARSLIVLVLVGVFATFLGALQTTFLFQISGKWTRFSLWLSFLATFRFGIAGLADHGLYSLCISPLCSSSSWPSPSACSFRS